MVKKKSIAVWAGMTDRAMTYRRTRWTERRARRRKKVRGEASNRVGRNDRLGSGLGKRGRKEEARKREEVAKGRGPERPIESERRRRSRKMVTEEARRVGEPDKRLPRTEWAGMTDWVQV